MESAIVADMILHFALFSCKWDIYGERQLSLMATKVQYKYKREERPWGLLSQRRTYLFHAYVRGKAEFLMWKVSVSSGEKRFY